MYNNICDVHQYTYWGERSEPRIGGVNANSVCMYVIDRPVVLRMRRNMLSTCCSCARPTNALHSPSNICVNIEQTIP